MAHLILVLALAVTSCMLSTDALGSVGSPDMKDSASGLLSLMNILHGNFKFGDVLNLGSLMKSELGEAGQIIKISPLITSVIQQAASKNPRVKLLQTVLDGNTPSLAEIIKMATTQSESIAETLKTVTKQNKKWRLMKTIMQSGPSNDHEHLKEILEILFDRKIDENMVKLNNNKYTVSELSNLALQNVLKLAYFYGDNYKLVKKFNHLMKHSPNDIQRMLTLFTKADLSNFPTTMITDVHKTPSTNPDSVHLLNDIKTKYPQILAEHDNKKASAAVVEALTSLLKVTDEVLTEAESVWKIDDSNKKNINA